MDNPGLLAELVALQTISGDADPQRRAIELCLSLLRQSNNDLRVETDLDNSHPWAVLTNSAHPDARRLAFCCHVDTVPAGPLSSWSFPPFGAEVHDGRLVGRGSTDMKGGIVATLAAMEYALGAGVPVALVLTSDEEVGALGAKRSLGALEGLHIGAAIIPEATGNVVKLGHRGALWLRVHTSGIAAHGGTPHLGRNAILTLMDLLQRARTDLPHSINGSLGQSTWNVGLVAGGTAPNIVAGEASIVVDHRTVHNERALQQWWSSQPESDEVLVLVDLPAIWTPCETAWVGGLPGTVSNSPVPYFTDAAVLSPVLPGVPVVIWGPGDPATMHAADEAVALTDVDVAVDYYRRVIVDWDADGQADITR